MGWRWAGLVTVAALGLSLADSRDLLSPTEQLWQVHFGTWRTFDELSAGELAWSFAVTPLAAWWGMAVGGLMALVGWQSRRDERPLPFGWIGGVIWLTTLGQLFAANLMVQFVMLSAQTMGCALWWAKRRHTSHECVPLQSFLFATLAGDVCGLWGVLLTGSAWGTLSVVELSDLEILQTGWRLRPSWCGLAGLFLFLGVLGRGGLFPFVVGTRLATSSSGLAGSLVYGCCLWPSLLWHVVRILPVLSVAPESVAMVQGVSLLASGIAAFVATGQPDRGRIAALLATSQIGLLLSAAVVPGTLPLLWLLTIAVTLGVSATVIFVGRGNRFFEWFSWWMLAGGCLSPVFWMSSHAVEQFQQWPAETVEAVDSAKSDTFAPATESTKTDSYRVRPLPVATWTAAWCVASFFGTFAAWRGWRPAGGVKERENEGPGDALSSAFLPGSPSLMLSILLAGCAVASAWQTLYGGMIPLTWPIAAAIASSLAGGSLAWWVCLDLKQMDSRFQSLGKWSDLARQELALPELAGRFNALVLSPLTRTAGAVHHWLLFGSGDWGAEVSRRVVSAGEELRNESDVFYAVALAMTVGSLVVTWWALAG